MSSLILTNDIEVFYLDENRQKRLEWNGSATGTRTMNEVYSAMANLLDEATTGDDATCMTAETPVEYTIGIIDANDADPWYISYDCLQHLTGGALKTSGWTHADGSAVGIIVVEVVNATRTIVAADYGYTVSGGVTGSGTLLEILSDGSTNDYLVIRPDDDTSGNQFTSSGQTITSSRGAFTAVQHTTAISHTGEQIWANLYNVTPIDGDTHVYMYQGTVEDAARARVADLNDNAQDWWAEGAFDRCFFTNDPKTENFDTIDSGYITVFARKGNTLFDSFEVLTSTTSGGRNPVPISASADGNNTTGYASITLTGGSGTFSVGDVIYDAQPDPARGVLTQIDSPGATPTLHYYLIGDPLNDITASDVINNEDDDGTGTEDGSGSTPQGPALTTWFTNNAFPSIAHGFTTVDIDDTGGAEGYGININCNDNTLTEVYEWTKYITRNGYTTPTTSTDGIEGEQYVGATVFLEYSGAPSGTINEDSDVTQETSGATGVIISHDEANNQIVLRDTRGTFFTNATTATLTSNDDSETVEIDTTADNFNAVKSAPFGSLAGGRFFGARGVVLSNWVSGDENSFQLIDSAGIERTRPIAITLSISNLTGTDETTDDDDYVVMHRLTGLAGAIDKTEYSSDGTGAVLGTSLVVDGSITSDTPGKTTGGVLNIRDESNANQQYRIRFTSWTSSTFTLANTTLDATATTNTTQIQTSGEFTNAKRGDLVWNNTRSAVSYIKTVDSVNIVQIDPPIASQTDTDDIYLNVLPIAMDTLDDVYVSLIDLYPTTNNASVSIVYGSQMYYRVKVANTRNAEKIKRFVTDDTTTGSNRNVATIRNIDTIIN